MCSWATAMEELPGNEGDSDLNMSSQRDSRNNPVLPAARENNDISSPLMPSENDNTEILNTEVTSSCDAIKPFRCCINTDRLNQLRKKVEDAIKDKKSFTIKGGFQYVRNALLHRGWIERIEFKSQYKNFTALPPTMDEVCTNLPVKQEWETTTSHIAKCEKMIISRLLQNHEVDFYWNMRKDSNEWQQRLNKNKIINRFSRSLFTSKEGLCLLLQQMYWHTEPGVAYLRFPRCYTINFADQCTAFIEDFRLTACISLLKWFTQKMHREGQYAVCSNIGRVPTSALQFAMERCNEYIAGKKHLDLDRDFHKVWDHEWEQFLTNFQMIVHDDERFDDSVMYTLFALESSAKSILKNISPFWPQIDLDGLRNIWIMKPGNKCRGRDITLIKDVREVVRVMNHKLKYVVQKYVERPLLIYKTKFDIRQWFMVTSVQPLVIWMYRDCYLRFSSQKFCLDDFHESVHLTNHAVQHKYTNQDRDKSLPDDNMWDNHTFKAYLRQIGQAEKWYKSIYPGLKECIIAAMLASQDTMDRRPNTFELYGADFMISDNFIPWLIEINSCPAMGPTTSVTARMCPQCFEDVIKVVIDRRRDPKADTGLFDQIYKQTISQTPAYLGMTLSVRGRKIFKKKNSVRQKEKDKSDIIEIKHKMKSIKQVPAVGPELYKNYSGPIIENMFQDSFFRIGDNGGEKSQQSVKTKRASGMHDLIVTQKPTVIHQRTNHNIFLDRKLSTTKDGSTTAKKIDTRNQNRQKYINNNKSAPSRSLSLYNKWKQGLENKQVQKSSDHSWEQDTASILERKTDLLKSASEESRSSASTNYLSSIARILPEIDNNDKRTNSICQSFFTVGLGYKTNCYKPVVNENILLPMGTQPTMEPCYLKL